MPAQLHLSFEQALLDAVRSAKASSVRAKQESKRQAELDKLGRRLQRESARRERTPDQVALCGLYYYNRSPRTRANGSFWHNCVRCGQPLQYYDSCEEAQAHNRECQTSSPTRL